MAIINIPAAPPSAGDEALERGAFSAGTAVGGVFLKQRRARKARDVYDWTQQLLEMKQAGGTRDDAIALTPPAALLETQDQVAARFAIIDQIFQPTRGPQELEALFIPTVEKPTTREHFKFHGEIPKGTKRPSPDLLTREEIGTLFPFAGEGRQPSESDKAVFSELRSFGLKPTQPNIDAVRNYLNSEGEIKNYVNTALGEYNKDLGRFEINRPENVRKAARLQTRIKALMFNRKAQSWSEAAEVALDELGVEPPKNVHPTPTVPEEGALQRFQRFFSRTATGGAPAPAPAPTPAQQPQVKDVVIEQKSGISIPSNLKTHEDAVKHLVDRYKVSPQQADQMLRRFYGSGS